MRPLARELLAGREDAPVHLAYGTATATDTVRMDGEATAVAMPALTSVASGQRAAVLKSGGDRVIVGPVGGPAANYTTIVAATNFSATLNMYRWGPYATLQCSITRTGANVAAGTATVATIGVDGRGSMATFTQSLVIRSTGAAALDGSRVWLNASTGVITVERMATWNTGVVISFTGTVLLDT
jgi:hypothetical protein